MHFLLIFLILWKLSFAEECPAGTNLVRVRRKTGPSYSMEESFSIHYVNGTVAVADVFIENNAAVLFTYCLDIVPPYSVYKIRLSDSYRDAWTSGSSVELIANYGNTILKSYLRDSGVESVTHSFVLHYVIVQRSIWKMSSTFENYWYEPLLSIGWSDVTLPNHGGSSSGTRYFRKSFTGPTGFAAYEVGLFYQYGIIAYVHGAEIFRDNMASGAVSHSSISTSAYTEPSFRGVVRSGRELVSNSVMAVELHYPYLFTGTVFDAWLAIYQSSLKESDVHNCFVVPQDLVATTTAPIEGYQSILDWSYDDGGSGPASIDFWFEFAFNFPIPLINGLFINPGYAVTSSPRDFTLSGITSTDEQVTVFGAHAITYQTNVPTFSLFSVVQTLYKKYRMSVQISASDTISITEMHPLVCNLDVPQSFSYADLVIHANAEDVEVYPLVSGLSQCNSTVLPPGLSLLPGTCTLVGRATQSSASQVYLIDANYPRRVSGTIRIKVETCEGAVVVLRRKYGAKQSTFEQYSVTDFSTEAIIYRELAYSGQVADAVKDIRICPIGRSIRITMDSVNFLEYWQTGSQLTVLLQTANEYETIATTRYNQIAGAESTLVLTVKHSIAPLTAWYYRMGYSAEDWYKSDLSTWSSSSSGSFPQSPNRFQVYRSSFYVGDNSKLSAYTLSLRYQYGIVVYINNKEVFRNHCTSQKQLSFIRSTGSYSSLMYRYVTLPIQSYIDGITKTFIPSNTEVDIAIALIAPNDFAVDSTFDCALRIHDESQVPRFIEAQVTAEGIVGTADSLFLLDHLNFVSGTTCNNWVQVQFPNDRREWISSFTIVNSCDTTTTYPTSFMFQGKNAEDDQWATLSVQSQLVWWLSCQRKTIYVTNWASYNMYRFVNINSGNPLNCNWKVTRISIHADSTSDIPESISYIPNDLQGFVGTPMTQFFPNSPYLITEYRNLTSLPVGIYLDPATGAIMGTPTEPYPKQTVPLYAVAISGEWIDISVTMSVAVCSVHRNLVTISIQTDENPWKYGFTIYRAYEIGEGVVVAQREGLYLARSLTTETFCLDADVYSLKVYSTVKEGWSFPSGWILWFDNSLTKVKYGHVPASTEGLPYETCRFSTHLPMTIGNNYVKGFTTGYPGDGWKNKGFDDSTWTTALSTSFGFTKEVTTYYRFYFDIPDLTNFETILMRVRIPYGCVVHLNGKVAARFNLNPDPSHETEALSRHYYPMLLARFHIVLESFQATATRNVFAFEVHNMNNSEFLGKPIGFDAVVSFSIDDCSLLIDSVASLVNNIVAQYGSITDMADGDPVTYVFMPKADNTYAEWSVESLDQAPANSYFLLLGYQFPGYGWTISARMDQGDDWIELHRVRNYTSEARTLNRFSLPLGMIGARTYRLHIDSSGETPMMLSQFGFQYCHVKNQGHCDMEGEFPSVLVGEVSPAVCDAGYTGYKYRECTENGWGEIKYDKCAERLPTQCRYAQSKYTIVQYIPFSTDAPVCKNIVHGFTMESVTPLPAGLFFNSTNGVVHGVVSEIGYMADITVLGFNSRGRDEVSIRLESRERFCPAVGAFPQTPAGKSSTIDCRIFGSYIGSKSQSCEDDNKWGMTIGICIPHWVLYLVVAIAVILVVSLAIYYLGSGNVASNRSFVSGPAK